MNLKIQPASEWANGKEGLFALPEATYRPSAGVNQSALKIMARSIAHYRESQSNPMQPTPDMVIGSLVHLSVLEPEHYGNEKSHVVQPSEYETTAMQCPSCGSVSDSKNCRPCKQERQPATVKKKWSGNSETCRDWTAKVSELGLHVISEDTLAKVEGMKAALLADPMTANFLKKGHKEIAAYSLCPFSGLMRKAKLDIISAAEDAVYIGDLKKTDDCREDSVARKIAKYGYHIQAAFSISIVESLLQKQGVEVPNVKFINGFIEDMPPHELQWYEMDNDALALGNDIWRRTIVNFSHALKEHKSPGYDKSIPIKTVALPKYAFNA